MSITAKFKVNRAVDMGWGTEVEMTPDYAQGRNVEWSKATPAGMCRLTVTDEAAAARFAAHEGKPVTLTFELDAG